MATSGADRKLKVWDLRTWKQLSSCPLKAGAGHMTFSQRTLLACAVDRQVQVSLCLVSDVISVCLHVMYRKTSNILEQVTSLCICSACIQLLLKHCQLVIPR